MAEQSRPVLTLTIVASGSVAANRFVTATGALAGADGNAIGVTRAAAAAAGEMLPVTVLGTAAVTSGAPISAGATVKSDAQGRAIPWAFSGARLGVALTPANSAGQFVEVFLIPNAA